MGFRTSLLAMALCCLVGISAQAAAHTQARLMLSKESARPGETVLAGVQLKMDPAWHTYWKNPGASGMATQVKWSLPPGVTVGEIQWPLPEKLPDGELTTYIYKDEVVLLAPVRLAPDMPAGSLQLKAEVSWLECNTMCLPGSATAQASLLVGPEDKPSENAGRLATWERRVPKAGNTVSARAWWGQPANGDTRLLVLQWHSAAAASSADFYPDGSEQFEIQPATERLPPDAGTIRIAKQVKKLQGGWPRDISGVLVQRNGGEPLAYEVKLPVESSGPGGLAGAMTPAGPGGGWSASSLWKMLLYAFLGGLILNVMPCVLPVIALKILGFVSQAKDEPRRVRRLGLMYGLGVLVSFLALAGVVIGVKAAGYKAGWGMQFSNPQFVVVLTVLVTLVALNLFGLFEINPGGRVMNAAGALSAKHGMAGAFFNGVLATVLATPCTAPFLGAALGFAFAQQAAITVLMFLVVGLGLALPYVLLSWEPAWLKLLPKPGLWMQRFKVAMGFPMLATAVWLFSLLPLFYGARTVWLAVFLLIVALVAWIYGEFIQRGRVRRGLAALVCLLLVAFGYGYVVEGQLQWRSVLAAKADGGEAPATGGIAWQPWSPQAVAEGRAAGRPVLVDFTAAWCLTCQANKKFAIDVPPVRAKIKSANVLPLLGDYTRFPENITTELNRFGRAGVPLVLVYPRKPDAPPIVLPEALTAGIVLNALERASQ